MSRLKIVVVMVGLILSGTYLRAQVFTDIPPTKKKEASHTMALTVGDEVPDFKLKLINADKKTANIRDFNQQLLILDFWNTGCSSCIAALPEMEALQRKFGTKIKILPITLEAEKDILPFWKNNNYTKKLSLPSVVEDSNAHDYFPHIGVPHEVWIYKGKVAAITFSDYVKAINIQKILDGERVDWPVKNDFYKFDANKIPLFSIDQNQIDTSSTFLKYAAIRGYKSGVNSVGLSGGREIVRDKQKKTIRTYILNEPILTAYIRNWIAVLGIYPDSFVTPDGGTTFVTPYPNAVVWEVADKSKYFLDEKLGEMQGFVVKNGICFESLQPDTGQNDKAVYISVIKDLDRLLGLHVRWEKRKEKVLVLIRTNEEDKLKSKQVILMVRDKFKNYPNRRELKEGNLYHFRDVGLNRVVDYLNKESASNPYVFDETGYTGNVDMDLNIPSWSDINAVRKEFAPYGLALKEEERLVDKLIFTEVNGGLLVDGQMQAAAKAKREAQAGMKIPTDLETQAFMEANKKRPGIVELPSGLQYKVLQEGAGAKPSLADKVALHYIGTLINGKIFDSSKEKGIAFITGLNDVIPAWTEALQLMPLGSKWMIYVPAELAYGNHTAQGTIPPNSVVIFEVELLRIIK